MVRCFIAVEVDDKTIIDEILKIQGMLGPIGLKVKCVEPENTHLTLKFLGEIAEVQVRKAIEALNGLKFTPFQLRFKGVGAFPNTSRPRVVWVGTSEGATEISQLAERADKLLSGAGFPSEARRFRAHLTIARVKYGGGPALTKLIQSHNLTNFGVLEVESVKLKKSDLTPKGPIYTTLNLWRASEE